MEYIFFGVYWLFCTVRAMFAGAFGNAQYGRFNDFDHLFLGFFPALLWFIVAVFIVAIFGGYIEGTLERRKS